ncbi:MAG: glycosyltransferase, partial [Lentilitoribacter sp.]
MLNRIRQLFHRYTEFHGRLFVQGFDLKNNDGDTLGCIDRIGIERGRLIVEGWTFASMVELTCGNHSVQESPSLTRVDVAQHYDLTGSANFGFRLDLPNKLDQKILSVNMEGQSHTFKFDGVGEKPLRKMRLRYVVPFLSALLRSTPDILRWRFKQDLSARARIKTSLGLNAIVERAILNASLFAKDKPKSVQVPNAAEITIILPVYNAFDLLPAVLTHVLENTDLPYRFIIVEDMSTDEAVRPYLHQWHAGLASDIKDRVEVLENAENLG